MERTIFKTFREKNNKNYNLINPFCFHFVEWTLNNATFALRFFT